MNAYYDIHVEASVNLVWKRKDQEEGVIFSLGGGGPMIVKSLPLPP